MNAQENFVTKSSVKHGSFYSYSNVYYVNSRTPVIITCSIHGDFTQTPNNHLQGSGCKECSRECSREAILLKCDPNKLPEWFTLMRDSAKISAKDVANLFNCSTV